MKLSEIHDTLVVRKGPEDGSEYPLTASPLYIGTDPVCLVQVQLDVTVQPRHARATAANGGYRIRSAEGAPVYVNGRRAGMVRSQLLKPGESIKVGYTELVLGCAKQGLADSASEPWTEKDIVWAGRALAAKGLVAAGSARSLSLGIQKFALRHRFLSLLILVAALYFLAPPFRQWVTDGLRAIREALSE